MEDDKLIVNESVWTKWKSVLIAVSVFVPTQNMTYSNG